MYDYKIVIFGQTPSKKSSQQIIRTKKGLRIIPNKKYMEWEDGAVFQVKSQFKDKTITQPVHIWALVYRRTKRKIDLTNLLQAIHDVLQKARVIKDDFLIENIDKSRRILGVNKGEERAEIFIKKLNQLPGMVAVSSLSSSIDDRCFPAEGEAHE